MLGQTAFSVPEGLNLNDLDQPYCCVIQLAIDPRGVLRQVILRPDKIKDGLIRLGETPGDEANGWQSPQSIYVLSVLGTAKETNDKKWEVTPIASSYE